MTVERALPSVLYRLRGTAIMVILILWGESTVVQHRGLSAALIVEDLPVVESKAEADPAGKPPQLTVFRRRELTSQLNHAVIPLNLEFERRAGDVRRDPSGLPKLHLAPHSYFWLAVVVYAETTKGPVDATLFYKGASLTDGGMTPENRGTFLALFSLGHALEGEFGQAGASLQESLDHLPLFPSREHLAVYGVLQRRAIDVLGGESLSRKHSLSCSTTQLTRALLTLDDNLLQAFLFSEAALFLTPQKEATLRCVELGREAYSIADGSARTIPVRLDYAEMTASSIAYESKCSPRQLSDELLQLVLFHNRSAMYLLGAERVDLLSRIGALQYRLGIFDALEETALAMEELRHATKLHSAEILVVLLRALASHQTQSEVNESDVEFLGALSAYDVASIPDWYLKERDILFTTLARPLASDPEPFPNYSGIQWTRTNEGRGYGELYLWNTNRELMDGRLHDSKASPVSDATVAVVPGVVGPSLGAGEGTVKSVVFYPVLIGVVVALAAMCLIILRLRDETVLLQERAAQFEEAESRRRVLESQTLRNSRLDNLAFQAIAAAHDLVNFMTAILHYATNTGRIASNPEPLIIQRNSEALESAATKATGVAKKLMSIATRIRTPEPASDERSPGDLNEIILRDPQFLRVLVQEKGDLEFELAPRELIIACSPDYVELVIHNLVSNAAAACQPGSGKVVVRTGSEVLAQRTDSPCLFGDRREGGSFHWLEVSDNGTGVSAEAMAKLFRTNFTDRARGNGIGLLTVLGVVNQHDGLIRLTTSPEGSTFRVLLPTSEAIAEKRSFSGLGDRSGFLGRIGLVAENAEPIDAALRRVLGPDKVSVVRFKTANAAVDWALSAGDCLGIISTVSEPEFAFLQLPRLEGEGREVPVMILADDGLQFEKMRAQSRLIRSVQSRDSDADSVAEAFVEHCLASPAQQSTKA